MVKQNKKSLKFMKDEDLHFDINDLLKLLPIENNKIKETFYIRVTIKKEVNNEQ